MFEPLGEIIDMLRNYGVAIPEESLVQLNELPEKWANTKRLSVIAIQQVGLLFPTSGGEDCVSWEQKKKTHLFHN